MGFKDIRNTSSLEPGVRLLMNPRGRAQTLAGWVKCLLNISGNNSHLPVEGGIWERRLVDLMFRECLYIKHDVYFWAVTLLLGFLYFPSLCISSSTFIML